MAGVDRMLHVGTVGKPHGVRGEVKVVPEVEEPQRLEAMDVLFVGASEEVAEPLIVEQLRYQHSSRGLTLLVKFGGFDTPEAVDALRRHLVLVPANEWGAVDGDVLDDVIGFVVFTPEGERLGTLTQVLEMPAHQLYEVTRDDGRTALVPVVDEFVQDIDVDTRRVIMSPIEGLFD